MSIPITLRQKTTKRFWSHIRHTDSDREKVSSVGMLKDMQRDSRDNRGCCVFIKQITPTVSTNSVYSQPVRHPAAMLTGISTAPEDQHYCRPVGFCLCKISSEMVAKLVNTQKVFCVNLICLLGN